MKPIIKLSNQEIKELLGITSPDFPKYSTQLLNLANQNAQGTRPAVVGQMSDLIQEFSGKSVEEWEQWYLKTHPDAIRKATEKIVDMLENLKEAMNKIDRSLVEKWVHDLIIVKTFIGLRFQEAILKKVSRIVGKNYRLASMEDESKGIDGYLDNTPVSIKPETYKTKRGLEEKIEARIIYYKKVKDGLLLDLSELL